MSTHIAPINRKIHTMEGIRVDVLTESNRIIELTLSPGAVPEDILRRMGVDEEFIVFPAGLGRLNF